MVSDPNYDPNYATIQVVPSTQRFILRAAVTVPNMTSSRKVAAVAFSFAMWPKLNGPPT